MEYYTHFPVLSYDEIQSVRSTRMVASIYKNLDYFLYANDAEHQHLKVFEQVEVHIIK